MAGRGQSCYTVTGPVLPAINLGDDRMTDSYSIVGTCINCTTPASLLATMTLIAIGAAMAVRSEPRGKPTTPDLLPSAK